MKFWVFTAISTPIFWDVKPYSLAHSTNAPRKPAVSIFSNPDRGRRDTGLEAVRIQVFLRLPHKYWQTEFPSNTAKSVRHTVVDGDNNTGHRFVCK